MFTSAFKKQTSVCCSISFNPYMVFQTWNHGKRKEKRKAILLLAYIADGSCLTNRTFYMRTLSLTIFSLLFFLILGNVSLHYFSGRGKGESIRLLMEDNHIPYIETKYTTETWKASKLLGFEDGLYVFGESMLQIFSISRLLPLITAPLEQNFSFDISETRYKFYV